MFALKLAGTRDYVSVSFDDTQNLLVRNYEVETPELFEKVLVPSSYASSQFDLICIRSVFNLNFITIDEKNGAVLKGE